jgi:hypothetical protein
MEIKKYKDFTPNFYCETCDFTAFKKNDYQRHLSTRKHLLSVKVSNLGSLGSENYQDFTQKIFICDKCNYSSTNKANYNKHLSSQKHLNTVNDMVKENICNKCNKPFASYSGLYKHKKTCQVLEDKTELSNEFREPDIKKPEVTIDLVLDLIKQNKELQNVLIEQSKEHSKQIMELAKNQSVTNNNNNTNCNNTQFNLQFFLNETCKDAMNITDFVNSLQLTTQDFENTGKVGFIEGITQIIINRLNSVDTTKRPMHCTDAKRETLYIKDDNVWNKDSEDKAKFKKVVNQVANKNLQQLNKWKDEHPDCINLDTPDNIDFRKYYRVALGGVSNEEDDKFFEKIKRNVLKEIVVDKSI